jgi:hypothetical protein
MLQPSNGAQQTKYVWSIRPKLQMDGKTRDLALFNLAIDSKLRGCDVVHLKVEDVASRGLTADQARVRQRKTGHPVKFEMTEQMREAVDAYIMTKQKQLQGDPDTAAALMNKVVGNVKNNGPKLLEAAQ